jgi:hypothetical protein
LHISSGNLKYFQTSKLQITLEHEKGRGYLYSIEISFKHKAFAEYFYAQALMKRGNVLLSEEIYEVYWMNVYFFFFGLKRDCPELLQELINISTSNEPLKILRMIIRSGPQGFSSVCKIKI